MELSMPWNILRLFNLKMFVATNENITHDKFYYHIKLILLNIGTKDNKFNLMYAFILEGINDALHNQ